MRKAISMQSEAITWSSESIRGKRRSQYLWGFRRRGEHLHARQGQRRTVPSTLW
jgi:hypothetical protein